MPARKPKPDERPQSEDFIETARALGGDETREGFDNIFAKITGIKATPPTDDMDNMCRPDSSEAAGPK
jgi:hypothetical protein